MAFGSEAWDAATRRDLDIAYAEAARKRQNDQIAFENQQKQQSTLSSLLTSGIQGGANPFGGVPAVSQDNRFAAGLTDAETRLRALLDNPDSVQQSAAYKFRVGQGQEALQRSLGAKGLLNSGNRLMELTKYGQDMGSQEYDAQAGRLSGLLGTYGQGYLGDKNANTSRFSAAANAWNQAQGNADQNRYRMASLAWDMQKGGGGIGRTVSGGMTVPTGTLGGIGGNWNPETDPGIQRMRENDWTYANKDAITSQGLRRIYKNSSTGDERY